MNKKERMRVRLVNNAKRLLAVGLVFIILPMISSCSNEDEDEDLIGTWYRMSDFDGLARSDASSFTINNKGYLVGGYDGKERFTDTWEYDMDANNWTQKAPFPGVARNSGIAFTLNGKGYYGTGYDGENNLKDFWEYDPATNSWTQKADFPSTARYGALAFAIGDKGYVGCGYDGNYQKDIYAYNPNSNTWEQSISIGGSKRMGGTAFVVNDIAYVCGGQNNAEYVDDFWSFDPTTSQWKELRDISNTSDDDYDDDYFITRANGIAFVIDETVFFTCGESGSLRTDTWKYYPTLDIWTQVMDFKGSARTVAVGFSSGRRGFVATGKSSTYRFDDIWELKPDEYDSDFYD